MLATAAGGRKAGRLAGLACFKFDICTKIERLAQLV